MTTTTGRPRLPRSRRRRAMRSKCLTPVQVSAGRVYMASALPQPGLPPEPCNGFADHARPKDWWEDNEPTYSLARHATSITVDSPSAGGSAGRVFIASAPPQPGSPSETAQTVVGNFDYICWKSVEKGKMIKDMWVLVGVGCLLAWDRFHRVFTARGSCSILDV